MALPPLAALRLRLTTWYVLTLGAILGFLGARMFVVLRAELNRQLDASLDDATVELMRAARFEVGTTASAAAPSFEAIDRLSIPGRTLYLLALDGSPLKPVTAEAWVRAAAVRAAARSAFDSTQVTAEGRRLRVHAERFTLENGQGVISAVVADEEELRTEYRALMGAFGGAGLVALVLVAGGGFFLSRKFTAPVERNIEHMRRFMADAAHELRTPIAVMRTSAEVALQRERPAAEYQASLRTVEREAERLGGIVEGLLTLARADADERPIDRRRFYLDDIVLDAAQAARTLATAKGVSLEVATFEEAPIDGDATLVRQLVMNVLQNAVKFTPAGGHVSVSVAGASGAPTVVVEDNGAGIAPEHLAHVFERFYRGDPARERGDGAGLGLSIGKWIADAHGAHIQVSSTVGKGTRVDVSFPRAERAAVSPS